MNVFLIANPTQYLSAIELLTQFPNRFEKRVLIAITDFVNGIELIDQYLPSDFWEMKFIINLSESGNPPAKIISWKIAYNKAIGILRNINSSQIIIGNIRDPILYGILLKLFPKPTIPIVLDDGTPTINVFEYRRRKLDYWSLHWPNPRTFIKTMLGLKIFLPLYAPFERYEFFTIFPDWAGKDDIVIQNEMNFMKSLYPSRKTYSKDFAYFIGTQIVEKGIVNKEYYLKILKNLVAEYAKKGIQVKYIKHRAESNLNIEPITKFMEVITFELPIEFAFLNKSLPVVFCGFFSTALFTLKNIHPEMEVIAYRLPDHQLNNSELESKDDIIRIYRSMEKTDIIVKICN